MAAIEELHRLGRPVLVGTISIEKAELLSRFLQRKNIPHQVLHGKNHEAEAAIISSGRKAGSGNPSPPRWPAEALTHHPWRNPRNPCKRSGDYQVIWEKKGGQDKAAGTGTGKAFASVLNEIEDRYKHEVSSIDQKFGHSSQSLRNPSI